MYFVTILVPIQTIQNSGADQKTHITNHNLQIAILYPVFMPKFATLVQIHDFSYTNTQIAQHGNSHAHFAQITNHKSQEMKIYFISL